MTDPFILIGLFVAVASILVALFAPEIEDDPLVVSFPEPVSQEMAAAIRDAVRRRQPNDPIILSAGATVSRPPREALPRLPHGPIRFPDVDAVCEAGG